MVLFVLIPVLSIVLIIVLIMLFSFLLMMLQFLPDAGQVAGGRDPCAVRRSGTLHVDQRGRRSVTTGTLDALVVAVSAAAGGGVVLTADADDIGKLAGAVGDASLPG